VNLSRILLLFPIIPILPGPDLACNAEAVLPGLINIIGIAIFAEEVAPGQAGRANTLFN
jgi:hypothetical protein